MKQFMISAMILAAGMLVLPITHAADVSAGGTGSLGAEIGGPGTDIGAGIESDSAIGGAAGSSLDSDTRGAGSGSLDTESSADIGVDAGADTDIGVSGAEAARGSSSDLNKAGTAGDSATSTGDGDSERARSGLGDTGAGASSSTDVDSSASGKADF